MKSGLARPERFERPTPWFVAKYSIQLSYGRAVRAAHYIHLRPDCKVFVQNARMPGRPPPAFRLNFTPMRPALAGLRHSFTVN